MSAANFRDQNKDSAAMASSSAKKSSVSGNAGDSSLTDDHLSNLMS